MNKHTRALQRLQVMKELGHEVKGLSYLPIGRQINASASLYYRIRHKLGFPPDLTRINCRLLEEVTTFKPDIIWLDKVNIIKPNTYQKIRAADSDLKIVYYSEDDIYLKHNRTQYLTYSLPAFDVVFYTKPRNAKELPRLGVKDSYCIYQAFDKHFHRPVVLSRQEQQDWASDATFIGSYEQDRADKLFYLAENGIQVRVWGISWDKFSKQHPNLKIEGKPLICDDYIKAINAAKVNLSFLRKLNRDQHTSRSLEIPACGAFLLTERTLEHKVLFDEGLEAEYFSSNSEMLEKVRYYLSHEAERRKIARQGRQRCLESDYSHHGRLSEMLAYIDSKKVAP
ncbi:MAG: glycosyltransferase [Cyanobacteria bacterium J06560_5]